MYCSILQELLQFRNFNKKTKKTSDSDNKLQQEGNNESHDSNHIDIKDNFQEFLEKENKLKKQNDKADDNQEQAHQKQENQNDSKNQEQVSDKEQSQNEDGNDDEDGDDYASEDDEEDEGCDSEEDEEQDDDQQNYFNEENNENSSFDSYENQEEDEHKLDNSNLERISFDFSVCNNFDDLPLNSDYYSQIKSLSFKGLSTSKNQKIDKSKLITITFDNMFPYSIYKLQTLKLKYCKLSPKFFHNLQFMVCLKNIQVLNFRGCHFDQKEFRCLLMATNLQNLAYLNVSQTNVDDEFCAMIADSSIVFFELIELDISQTQKENLDKICTSFPSIVHLDLQRCKKVVTSLIEDLFKHKMITRLAYLDLGQTLICNEFIDIIKQSITQQPEDLEQYLKEYYISFFADKSLNKELHITPKILEKLFFHKNLRYLSIKRCLQIREYKIKQLLSRSKIVLPKLEILNVNYTYILDAALKNFFKKAEIKFKNLIKIKMKGIHASSDAFQYMYILRNKQLIYIDLQNTNFDDEACATFFTLEDNKILLQLHKLNIKDCRQLTSRGLYSMIKGLSGTSFSKILTKQFNLSDQNVEIMLEQRKQLLSSIQKNQVQYEDQLDDQKKPKSSKYNSIFYMDTPLRKLKQTYQVCESFDVFQILIDCQQLVTDEIFKYFLTKLQFLVKNIYELDLQQFQRLRMDDPNFFTINDFFIFLRQESEYSFDIDTFKNLEILNLNDTRITNTFVQQFLKFWNTANSRSEPQMKNFKIISCQKAHYVDSSILDVFNKKDAQNLKIIIGKTQFNIEILLNELGQKLYEEHLPFFNNIKTTRDSKYVSTNIKELNLENNQLISSIGFQELLKSKWMKYVEKINLRYTSFGDTEFEFMTTIMNDRKSNSHSNSSQFTKLRYIGMKGCVYISKYGLRLLCQMDKLSKYFDLGCICEQKMLIDEEIMKQMAQSAYMCNAEHLDLSENGFNNIDAGFNYLCFKGRGKTLNIKTIDVTSTRISDKALQSIAVTENFCNLERMKLNNCQLITERGLSYLVDSKQLINFDLFHLFNSNESLISGRVVDTLKYSDRKKQIKEISLQNSQLQDKDINSIMSELISENLKIKTIDLRKTPQITVEGISHIYNLLQWDIVKNSDNNCNLEVLLIDNNRYEEFYIKQSYDEYKNELEKLKKDTEENKLNNKTDKYNKDKIKSLMDKENYEKNKENEQVQEEDQKDKEKSNDNEKVKDKEENEEEKENNEQDNQGDKDDDEEKEDEDEEEDEEDQGEDENQKEKNEVKEKVKDEETNQEDNKEDDGKVQQSIQEQVKDLAKIKDQGKAKEKKKKNLLLENFQNLRTEIKKQFKHKVQIKTFDQTKLNEILKSSFVQDLFLSAENLNRFRYDFFIRKYSLYIDNRFIDSLTLCDERWAVYKENKNNQSDNDKSYPSFVKQFEYFDISYNKILQDEPLCRFFLSTKIVSNLEIIDISNTFLSEQVVLAMCSSSHLTANLQMIYFDKCPRLNVKKALEYILLAHFKKFKYKSMISYYLPDVDDVILKLLLRKFNKQSQNKESPSLTEIGQETEKTKQKMQYLNLLKSKITSEGLKELKKSKYYNDIICLDLAYTGIEAEQFNQFLVSDKFPQKLKYIWIEGTYNLTDQKMNNLSFWKEYKNDNNLDLMEMIQSKSSHFSETLKNLTNTNLRDNIFKKSYIQLDIFQQIQSDTLIKLINDHFGKEYDQFKELKYIYLEFGKQHYHAIKQAFNWNKDNLNVSNIYEKFCFRIKSVPKVYNDFQLLNQLFEHLSIQNDIQNKEEKQKNQQITTIKNINPKKIRDSIQFQSNQFLCTIKSRQIMNIHILVQNQILQKLELEGTDISGRSFNELCDQIKGSSNFITYISLKKTKSIRDEHIICKIS